MSNKTSTTKLFFRKDCRFRSGSMVIKDCCRVDDENNCIIIETVNSDKFVFMKEALIGLYVWIDDNEQENIPENVGEYVVNGLRAGLDALASSKTETTDTCTCALCGRSKDHYGDIALITCLGERGQFLPICEECYRTYRKKDCFLPYSINSDVKESVNTLKTAIIEALKGSACSICKEEINRNKYDGIELMSNYPDAIVGYTVKRADMKHEFLIYPLCPACAGLLTFKLFTGRLGRIKNGWNKSSV